MCLVQKTENVLKPHQQSLICVAIREESHIEQILLFGLLRSYHHLGDKVDDGAGGLFGVVFGKQVTDVLCAASAFPCDEAKDPVTHKQTAKIIKTWVYT